jgi:hypothetical protein
LKSNEKEKKMKGKDEETRGWREGRWNRGKIDSGVLE